MHVPRSAFRVALTISLSALPLATGLAFSLPARQANAAPVFSKVAETNRQEQRVVPGANLSAASNGKHADALVGGQPFSQSSGGNQPQTEKELLAQAMRLHNQGDKNGAERLFKQVLSVNSRNADASFSLGAIAEENGDLYGALGYYRSALAANSSDKEAVEAIASVQQKLQPFRIDIRNHGVQPAAPLAGHVDAVAAGVETDCKRGMIARNEGREDEALACFQRALQQNPHNLQAMVAMAEIYSQRGQHVPALACYQMALHQDESNAALKAAVDLENSKAGLPRPSKQHTSCKRTVGFATNVPEEPKSERAARALVGLCGQVLEATGVVGMCTPHRGAALLWNLR